jgi:hypothetical protein
MEYNRNNAFFIHLYRIRRMIFLLIVIVPGFIFCSRTSWETVRRDMLLNASWRTIENDTDQMAYEGFQKTDFNDQEWKMVDVPHNWDDYGGYRRMKHGNRHGYAWYRKEFKMTSIDRDKRYFLWFEGVGSYATVWLNGDSVGHHAGGRTSFTLDVTEAIHPDGENILAVRADHPADIRDLPWVCGGCSPEWGFSEGSQPMGIFRSVHLIITNPVRIQPFGVHIWNDETITEKSSAIHLTTEIKNFGKTPATVLLVNVLKDANGRAIKNIENVLILAAGQCDTITQAFENIENPHLWSPEDPYLYTIQTEIVENDRLMDAVKTPYGIRWIKWDISGENPTNRFYLNGKPVFINGTAEYEHMLGQSHAFSDEQVKTRISQVRAAGFNAFRDAHQPHNLRYQKELDSLGVLWWPQMAAHIWFDNSEFRSNFKQLLTDWIRERRNSPSVILWGLENESTLPTDFAKECTALIRKLDPTASSQRLVTTCNGGTGTDWNVIQNWSGTYGGNPDKYDQELSRQLLNGEYGAWRSIDFHNEGDFEQNGPLTEDRFNLLMESKIRLAEVVKDRVCGQFHWLLASHDNPGRTQSGEGLRDLDRLGPVNYKGAFSIWGEPLDVYYLFRANYAHKETEPMVYIVSHTWPDRWIEPGLKSGIRVFSNCDEVELFNGLRTRSLGRKTNGDKGTHFTWDSADIQNNLLYAVGYVGGKEMVQDCIILNHLPKADGLEKLAGKTLPLSEKKKKNYLYRVNCGGPDYNDSNGNIWMADVHQSGENTWGSRSWTDNYPGLPSFFGSQRQTNDPIRGTLDWPLLQTFRYGRHNLAYEFPVPDRDYQVELYFIEPWYGTGGGMDCKGWRLFNVAVNGKVKITDLDIWNEAGHDKLLKKTLNVTVTGGKLKISFPEVKTGQAIVSAIAISTDNPEVKPATPSARLITCLEQTEGWSAQTWMNTGDFCYSDTDVRFVSLPPVLYGAEWIRTPLLANPSSRKNTIGFKLNAEADVYIGLYDSTLVIPSFIKSNKEIRTSLNSGTVYQLYQKRFEKGERVELPVFPAGTAQQVFYLIAAVPVSKMDDTIDLRPVFTLQADKATGVGQTRKATFSGGECRIVPGKGDAIEWQFSVALASKYGLEIRYLSPGRHPLQAEMSISGLDGTLAWKGSLKLEPTGDRWRSLRTDTQTTINAGIYRLRISLLEEGPIYFNQLKIQ